MGDNRTAEDGVPVEVDKRATGMLAVINEMKALKDKLPPRPALGAVQGAEKAVSEIDHRLIKQLTEIVEAKRPYGVEPGWFLALQAMREDRCRRDAEMEKRLHMAVLERDDYHRHYETIIMQAEAAIVNGGDGPVELSEELIAASAPRIIRYPGGSQLVSSPILSAANGGSMSPIALLSPSQATEGSRVPRAQSRTGGLSAALRAAPPAPAQPANEADSDQAPPKLLAMIEDAAHDKREKFDISEGFGSLKWLPETIGMLESLTHLDLSNNRLLFLPQALGSLTNLKILDIYGNDLIDLPETMSNLEHLMSLDFHSNKIEEIPVAVGGCGELVDINGDFNKIRALPEAIGQCINLQKLSFGLNQLKRLPRSIGNLAQLTDLDVHYNQLETLPETLCQLNKLTSLNIAAQHFDLQELPWNIGNMENLVDFNFSECYIKILPDSFVNLTNLTRLQLHGNPLQDPPIQVAEQGKEAIFEHIQQRSLGSSDSRSKGLAPRDIEITGGMKRFFRKASEAVGGPAVIGRRKSGVPSPAPSGALSTSFGGPSPSSSVPGSGFFGSLGKKESSSISRQGSDGAAMLSGQGSPLP